MKITDLLKPQNIVLNAKAASKQDVLNQITEIMNKNGNVSDLEKYRQDILTREKEGSTGVGEGVAIPHAKSSAVTKAGLAAMVLPEGVDFDSLDGQPAKIIFLIAVPQEAKNEHLDILSKLSSMLMNPDFILKLTSAKTVEDFLSSIAQEESKGEEQTAQNITFDILAVTACPTGIAHTFMAAQALEESAKKLNISLKVETNGANGIKNPLTEQDIAQAKAIIVAADKKVDTARFNGKKVIFVKVAKAIHEPDTLLQTALNGDIPVYACENKKVAATANNDSAWHKIYTYLMSGVSNMLPFVIAGGIFIALSFLLDKANAGTSTFGSGNNLALFFNKIGGFSFDMMFPVLAAYIAFAIADKPAFMLGFVGGIIAKSGFSLGLPQDAWQSSGFFGALIAGFAGGYIIILLKKLTQKLPHALEGIKTILIYPVIGLLIMALLMVFIVNPPMAAVNGAINSFLNSLSGGSKIILGAILGAMMSIDFGGPINKTAYVFGTVSLASQQYEIMAAVMAGGMVPPLAIAFSTLFFKKLYTEQERQTTVGNFIMGLSFITEGAIPFAVADPLRVIPACACGSAVAGALSMLFKCGLPAPHGGIFVLGVITNAFYFVLAILIGALVGMFLLSVLKDFKRSN